MIFFICSSVMVLMKFQESFCTWKHSHDLKDCSWGTGPHHKCYSFFEKWLFSVVIIRKFFFIISFWDQGFQAYSFSWTAFHKPLANRVKFVIFTVEYTIISNFFKKINANFFSYFYVFYRPEFSRSGFKWKWHIIP